jgi:hypothetical protein
LAGRLRLDDDLLIYVTVGADGKAVSVAAISRTLALDVKRMIGAAAARLPYKPARCGGQPCQGVVPFNLRLVAIH